MEEPQEESDAIIYQRLRRTYLSIYLLACLVDWLQGPYLYNIYLSLNYTKPEISLFYAFGFMSSGIFGLIIGNFADKFGRKKLCIVYFFLTIITCLCTVSGVGGILIIGRLFGGISTSILFSTFESWYISQHLLHYKLGRKYLTSTFARSSLYNGLVAIMSGFVASILADVMNYGPSAPFIFAIPISTIAAFLCINFWTENNAIKLTGMKTDVDEITHNNIFGGLRVIISSRNKLLTLLGTVEIIFETVTYIFIFLWTPVLEPIQPSYGYIFAIFMIFIVMGSFFYSILVDNMTMSVQLILCISVILALCSMSVCTVGIHLQTERKNYEFGAYLCLISFSFFEFSVGMYLPAMSYLRGVVIPENYRANVTNWLRLPGNLCITIILLLYITYDGNSGHKFFFTMSTLLLSIAALYSYQFFRVFSSTPQKYCSTLDYINSKSSTGSNIFCA